MSLDPSDRDSEHVDVLIVGAGISGIGMARYLNTEHPGKTYAILEARDNSGGTWDLFRYPGIRSDSDLHTFGYAFKPWENDKAIADGGDILAYLRETVAENHIGPRIRFRHKVRGAAWSSAEARWLVDVENTETSEHSTISAGWLYCAGGYYRYDEGFTPEFPGRDRFDGPIVHPQHWPEDLDYSGKKVVIIGSGATAVTLVPAMATRAAHVTMLQRSPTYVLPVPAKDTIANTLRAVIGKKPAYAIARRKNILKQRTLYRFCQRYPDAARRLIRFVTARQLPDSYPVDEHFKPTYNPWDQRMCAVPDSDMFVALRNGSASVVTDRIATFTENGITCESGRHIEADVIVTATGLNLLAFGGLRLTVDGEPVNYSDTTVFRGMMLSGVPNFGFAFGYTNSSWTLKVDLVSEHFCRLLAYMDSHHHKICRAEVRDEAMPTRPMLDFGAGYIQRATRQFPRQGAEGPWRMTMDYRADVKVLREGPVVDDELHFAAATDRVLTPC